MSKAIVDIVGGAAALRYSLQATHIVEYPGNDLDPDRLTFEFWIGRYRRRVQLLRRKSDGNILLRVYAATSPPQRVYESTWFDESLAKHVLEGAIGCAVVVPPGFDDAEERQHA